MLLVRCLRVIFVDVSVHELLSIWYLKVVISIFSWNIIVFVLLARFYQAYRVSNLPFHIINDQPWSFIEYKSSFPIITPLPKNVPFHHNDTVLCYLLIIQYHLIVNIFLNDSSSCPNSIWYFNIGGIISLLNILLGWLLTVKANTHYLKSEKSTLNLRHLMKWKSINPRSCQLLRNLRYSASYKLHL